MSTPRTSSQLGLLLARFTLRHWRQTPRATALQVLILALGIAVFFSIRLANRAAVTSFQNFTGLLAQSTDFVLTAPAGHLAQSVLAELRPLLGEAAGEIIPVLETTAAVPRQQGDASIGGRDTLTLVGLDLVSVQNLAANTGNDRDWFNQAADGSTNTVSRNFWEYLDQTNAAFISPALARKQHWQVGETIPLVIDETVVPLHLAGLIPTSPARPAPPENLLILDLPVLQQLAHRPGQLSRIEFLVPDGPRAAAQRTAWRTTLEQHAAGRWKLSTPADRRESADMMTRAFRMNLTILSLIGLLVGLYLIFQSLDGAVVRRREEIGILRSLGITERDIRRAWLCEAALLGSVGGLAGVLIGWGGAQFAVRFVGQTVNALYYTTSVRSARLDLEEVIFAVILAVGASLVAGWWPARQAAKTPPAQILSRQQDVQTGTPWLQSGALALALLGLAGWLVTWHAWEFAGGLRFPLGGYLAALALILGGGILCGLALRQVGRWLRPAGRFALSLRLAASHLAKSSSRHRLAAAGLKCAMTMACGMVILVASFEETMQRWIANTFQADLYIHSDGAQSAATDSRISAATWQALAKHPDVADANVMETILLKIDDLPTMLVGVDMAFSQRHPNLTWYQKPLNDDVFDPAKDEHLALISESFADRFHVQRGDMIHLPTPNGEQPITVAGVFSDYGNERGSLVMERRHCARWFADDLATSLIVYLRPGVNPDNLRAELEARYPGLSALTNGFLRGEILRVFRQTFAVTYALELIGIIVAVIGLGMTLSSILLDRRNELTTLRALGVTRHEMARATALEGTLLAMSGVVAGLIASLALGWILIHVINKQSFGWTLVFQIPWGTLAAMGALVILIGTVVAYLVGHWGSNLAADREE